MHLDGLYEFMHIQTHTHVRVYMCGLIVLKQTIMINSVRTRNLFTIVKCSSDEEKSFC